ncbi:hypothetical protein [Dictyobacter arantiisoli]|uniref:hypothetical protein n=1 Tax=Dictyobacter arantiisoli TaxID=2014874 RepID=UPI0011EEEAC1|nr:hypothetical protein [Dictyobacter arantiisoli]
MSRQLTENLQLLAKLRFQEDQRQSAAQKLAENPLLREIANPELIMQGMSTKLGIDEPLRESLEQIVYRQLGENPLPGERPNPTRGQQLIKQWRIDRFANPTTERAEKPVPELRIDEPTYSQKFRAAFNLENTNNERDTLVEFKYWSDLFDKNVAQMKDAGSMVESKVKEFSERYEHLLQPSDNNVFNEIESLREEIEFLRIQLSNLPEAIKHNITSMETGRQRYQGDQADTMDSIINKAQEELGTLPNLSQHIDALTALHSKVSDTLSPPSGLPGDIW